MSDVVAKVIQKILLVSIFLIGGRGFSLLFFKFDSNVEKKFLSNMPILFGKLSFKIFFRSKPDNPDGILTSRGLIASSSFFCSF
jgi:hypothetical protein